MIEFRSSSDNGSTNGWMITSIVSIVLVIIMAGFLIWVYMNYVEQKTNVETKISAAVSKAEKEQAEADEAKFNEREKEPNTTFIGPDDYGRVSFSYPKTWSVYVESDASKGGDYKAYLNPRYVLPVNSSQQFALRVLIENDDYVDVISSYDSLIKNGKLKSSTFTVNGVDGTRYDGSFSDDIRGSAVILKIRDKALTIRTDSDTFRTDFDKLIATIVFE